MDKIICLGKNYAEHAKELGEALPEKPVLFLKPPSVLKAANKHGDVVRATLPRHAGSVHHECEIVLRLGQGGYQIPLESAGAYVEAVSLGLDMTLRERQSELKKKGHPWTTSKVFPDAAIVGAFVPYQTFPNFDATPFSLKIDGVVRQTATAREMLFGVAAAVAYASEFFPLVAGDLIFTGTPKGVNSVEPGQKGDLAWGDIFYSVHW